MGLALCSALLSINCSVSNAQDYTTGNILNNQWWNATTGTGPAPGVVGHTSGGPAPLWDPNQGILFFSYGNVTAFQESYVPNALVGTPSGIQVKGYTYSYDIRNMNFDGRQGSTDTITATITMRGNPSSIILDSVTNVYNTQFDWTTFSGTRTLTSPVAPSATGWMGIYFNSRDTGFWAGYYGPQVRNVSLRVNYGVDPCATNPAYSVTCAGFGSVVESANKVPNPTAYASWNGYIDNSFAIQTALSQGGSGLQVHGFNYGYTANSGGSYCALWVLVCLDNRDPYAQVNVNITSNTGQSLYSVTRTHQSINPTNFSYQYRFDTSQSLSTLGNFGFDAYAMDNASVSNMWATILYTPDQCILNPLSSPTCPGYGAAYAATLSSSSSSTSSPTITYNASSGYTSIALAPDSTRTDPTVQNAGGVELTTSGELSAPDNVPTVVKESTKETKKQQSTTTTTATSIALSTIAKNEKREQSIIKSVQDQAAAQAASAQADQQTVIDSIIREQTSSQRRTEGTATENTITPPTSSSSNNTISNTIQNTAPRPAETATQSSGPSVNKNAPNNEIAGGVDIATIARSPAGFEMYMNGMADSPFYAPREIYRGQRTVDNARAERFLNGASDALHQRMVEQQYNIGN